MSRIIVKNFPNHIDVDKVKEKFSEIGVVTDVQLKYTAKGKFRNFGFIGFNTPEEASKAVSYFDKSFYGTSRLKVEIATELGSENKPKAWSKYAVDSSAYKKLHKEEFAKASSDTKDKLKNMKKKSSIKDPELIDAIKKYRNDPDFIEFMELHGLAHKLKEIPIDEDSGVEGSDNEEAKEEPPTATNAAADSKLSDLDYLKSKMKGSKEMAEKIVKTDDKQAAKKDPFSVKITNLPFTASKKDVQKLFENGSVTSVRMPRKGFAYVGFKTQKDLRKGLIKNKSFVGGNQIFVSECKEKETTTDDGKPARWKDQEEALKNEESIAESGRIFARNLSYAITEDEIQQAFSKFGPIAEIDFPIDKESRKPKGFCTVTFLMPEHATAAYAALDGTVLHGRMLHLLPGKAKDVQEDDDDSTNFKAKKDKALKAKAGSSYNWNTLFLDLNAVAETIAEKYSVTKEDVLMGKDAAVGMALAETQLVNETKQFLLDNGVKLDAFNQVVKVRSKNVILVKNLPAKTTALEIREKFAKFGVLNRVILPPSGVTAIVEFVEASEAKTAFRKLAYSKFKHLPLYLEWAPQCTFEEPKTETGEVGKGEEAKEEIDRKPPAPEDDIEIEEDTALFVKNLNFETTDDDLKKHFESCGKIASVTVARKKDPKKPGSWLSMGYGFVHFFLKSSLNEALKKLQGSSLQGHTLELKRSNRTMPVDVLNTRKVTNMKNQTGTKIIVRNIPFQATQKEIEDIFKTFGLLKFVRLPKKLIGTGPHRGFAFVEFLSKNDAKRAMESLGQSTHLFGRRLVLEWAESSEDVTEIRKRTAKHFHEDDSSAAKKMAKAAFSVGGKEKGESNIGGSEEEEEEDDDMVGMELGNE
ncbi:RNA recognition motif. (a.k.a. RRM, RBD, or RNP domain) [Nesidiocoris tenuis]|uniref:RNA recognition motif. (A.k.a. RRM, RBD, or RNP domain) n=1 Tax=Nesidiocoris tenuis TaxID=355587 RepID=A0ABN7B2J3_9HEMI|nr:RNA recognition motif. (a.k.a. RRM, RBD, or RNP domain) [Nesidiocoris tenuis]